MIICLDVGNTHIYGGVFVQQDIKLRFRYPSTIRCTSDVFGLFLKDVLDKNGLTDDAVQAIVLCSVVPSLNYSIISACKKYFSQAPLVLKPGVKTGLKLEVKNPLELGADRIANAVAAVAAFPSKNIIVTDFGTATSVCAIANNKTYLGGAIFPGFKLSMNALSCHAAQLSDVDIVTPTSALGRTTASNIQAGLYYGQLGGIKEIIHRVTKSVFHSEEPICIATGGYAYLFEQEQFFAAYLPDLVLQGLRLVWEKNK